MGQGLLNQTTTTTEYNDMGQQHWISTRIKNKGQPHKTTIWDINIGHKKIQHTLCWNQ